MDPWEGRGAAWMSQGWWLGWSWGLEDNVVTLWTTTTKKYKAGEVKAVCVCLCVYVFSYGECWHQRALAQQISHC